MTSKANYRSFLINHPGICLAAILALGLGLRCIALGARGITYDDAFSVLLARQPWSEIVQGTAADTMPPLYYFLLRLWIGLGQSIAFLRLLTVLFSLGAAALLFDLVRRQAGVPAGLWAAFFAAISPLQIYHAQDLRMYAPLAFFELGYLWFFFRLREKGADPRWDWNWVGLVACAALALYTHNLAVIGLAAPNLILLIERRWRFQWRLILAQVTALILFIPWLFYLPGQIAKIQAAFWTPRPGLVEILQSVILFHSHLPLDQPWFFVAVFLSLEILTLVILETVRRRKELGGSFALVWCVITPPLVLLILSYLMRPVYVTRSFIYAALIYLGWVGVIVAGLKNRVLKGFLAGSMVLAAAAGLPSLYTFSQFPRSNYRAAMEGIAQRLPAGGLVLHENKLSYFPAYLFSPDLDQAFLPDTPGSQNDTLAPATQAALGLYPAQDIAAAVQGRDVVYFVTFQESIQEYQAMGVERSPDLRWLDAHYQAGEPLSYGDLWVFPYTRSQP